MVMKHIIFISMLLLIVPLNSVAYEFSNIILENKKYRVICHKKLLTRIIETPNIRYVPVPYIGTYKFPYESVLHNKLNPFDQSAFLFINENSGVLKIANIQTVINPMVDGNSLNYNMHHLLYPDYQQKSDSSNNLQSSFSVRTISVNGVEQPDQLNLLAVVHDGSFSPSLPPVVPNTNEPFSIQSKIQLPEFNTKYPHPYAGFVEVQALNIVLTDQNTLGSIANAESVEDALKMIPEPFKSELVAFMSDGVLLTASSKLNNYGPQGLLSVAQPGWHAQMPAKFPENITVDFGVSKQISALGMLEQDGWSIRGPKSVRIDMSDDGITWRAVAELDDACMQKTEDRWVNIDFPEPSSGRYLKVIIFSNCGDPQFLTLRGLRPKVTTSTPIVKNSINSQKKDNTSANTNQENIATISKITIHDAVEISTPKIIINEPEIKQDIQVANMADVKSDQDEQNVNLRNGPMTGVASLVAVHGHGQPDEDNGHDGHGKQEVNQLQPNMPNVNQHNLLDELNGHSAESISLLSDSVEDINQLQPNMPNVNQHNLPDELNESVVGSVNLLDESMNSVNLLNDLLSEGAESIIQLQPNMPVNQQNLSNELGNSWEHVECEGSWENIGNEGCKSEGPIPK